MQQLEIFSGRKNAWKRSGAPYKSLIYLTFYFNRRITRTTSGDVIFTRSRDNNRGHDYPAGNGTQRARKNAAVRSLVVRRLVASDINEKRPPALPIDIFFFTRCAIRGFTTCAQILSAIVYNLELLWIFVIHELHE